MKIFLPKNNCFDLVHNQHKIYYDTIQAHLKSFFGGKAKWINKFEEEKSLRENNLWELTFLSDQGHSTYLFCDMESVPKFLNGFNIAYEEIVLSSFNYLSLMISRNLHIANNDVCNNIQEYFDLFAHNTDWVSEEDKLKCFDTNNFWNVVVYPHTPIGSYDVSGSNLKEIFDNLQS